MGSHEEVVEKVGATFRHQLVPPIHAVNRAGLALCGVSVPVVFPSSPWDQSDVDIDRCADCADSSMPEIEVSDNPFYD